MDVRSCFHMEMYPTGKCSFPTESSCLWWSFWPYSRNFDFSQRFWSNRREAWCSTTQSFLPLPGDFTGARFWPTWGCLVIRWRKVHGFGQTYPASIPSPARWTKKCGPSCEQSEPDWTRPTMWWTRRRRLYREPKSCKAQQNGPLSSAVLFSICGKRPRWTAKWKT